LEKTVVLDLVWANPRLLQLQTQDQSTNLRRFQLNDSLKVLEEITKEAVKS
jgi:hypothetical protein